MEKKEITITTENDDMNIKAEGCINIVETIGILQMAIYTLISGAVDKHIKV